MMLKNNSKGYGLVSIVLHWFSVLLVLGLFVLGYWMVDLNYYDQWYRIAPHWHKSVGMLFAMLIFFRILWNLSHKGPQSLGSKLQIIMAKLVHRTLYGLLFSLFFSGYLIATADGRGIEVFGWFSISSLGELFEQQADWSGLVHEWLAYAVMVLAILHAVAAISHHVISKDNTLKRMVSTRYQ